MIEIPEDPPFLGIAKGQYSIQQFIYDHFIRCWFNSEFQDWSDVVNFDWYHPPFAYRYERQEIEQWFCDAGVSVDRGESNRAQHYLEGTLPAM
jgi:hypothetical protein